MRHEIEYLRGEQLHIDPSVSMYPSVPGEGRGGAERDSLMRSGYAQFIPVCTSAASSTTYDYSVRTDAGGIGFDAYFVPSESQRGAYYGEGGGFEPYGGRGCSARNMESLSGTCRGVGPGGGLLLVLPDALDQSVTRVTVNLYERGP